MNHAAAIHLAEPYVYGSARRDVWCAIVAEPGSTVFDIVRDSRLTVDAVERALAEMRDAREIEPCGSGWRVV